MAQDAGTRLLEEAQRAEDLAALVEQPAGQEIQVPEVPGRVAETPCFPIEGITVTGVTLFDAGQSDQWIQDFAGHCLGQSSINNLLARISGAYADAGYITTRAYVPAQDISDRQLTIEVLEGRIDRIDYELLGEGGARSPGAPAKIATVLPLAAGDVFQLRDLEHGLEQMNRLRSTQVQANLTAGAEPGTSRIILTEQKQDPIRGSVDLSTRGSEATGRLQIATRLEVDDLLNRSDAWSATLSGTENSNALALSGTMPLRRWLLSANGSYSEELTSIDPTSDLLSQTATLTLTGERLLWRDARSKHFAYGRLNRYWNDRYINLAGLQPQNRTAVQIGYRNEHRMESHVLSTDLSMSRGTAWFGADQDPVGLPDTSAHAEFTKFEGKLNYLRPLANDRQLSVLAVGQLAGTPLYGNEQLSIGGWDSVRGYSGASASGDQGLYLRAELSYPTQPIDLTDLGSEGAFDGATGAIGHFVFLDAGYVFDRAAQSRSRMWGAGAGVSAQLGLFSVNGALAVPLTSTGGRQGGEVEAYIGLSVKLF